MSNETHVQTQGTGRVITRFGAELLVQCADRTQIRCTTKRKLDNVACGDWVEWQSNPTGTARINKILPRKNDITRSTYRGKPRTIAANVDQLLIVSAWLPVPIWELVDRYLIAAERLSADAVIIMNKSDLSELATDVDWQALADYEAIGYSIMHINALDEASGEQLNEVMRGKTNILLGRSGVGKSSIANKIMPDAEILTSDISDSGEGRHTTTTANLYELTDGAYLIDSPGVRDYALDNLSEIQLANGYREFKPYMNQCKFSNCTHNHEPQCAIRAAAEAEEISPRRYERYLAALNSM